MLHCLSVSQSPSKFYDADDNDTLAMNQIIFPRVFLDGHLLSSHMKVDAKAGLFRTALEVVGSIPTKDATLFLS